jgi:hypothetical protein
MGLIRDINEALEIQIEEQRQIENKLVENFNAFMEHVGDIELTLVFEDVEQFLSKLAQTIKTGNEIDTATISNVAAKLTALQLIADPGTRGAALSKIKGDNPGKKLTQIMNGTGSQVGTEGPVDSVLVRLANMVGQAATKDNIEMLKKLPQIEQKARDSKAAQIASTLGSFKKIQASVQTQQLQQTGAAPGATQPA